MTSSKPRHQSFNKSWTVPFIQKWKTVGPRSGTITSPGWRSLSLSLSALSFLYFFFLSFISTHKEQREAYVHQCTCSLHDNDDKVEFYFNVLSYKTYWKFSKNPYHKRFNCMQLNGPLMLERYTDKACNTYNILPLNTGLIPLCQSHDQIKISLDTVSEASVTK